MKKTILLSAFILLSLASVRGQPPPPVVPVHMESGTWINVAPPNAGFTILMPAKPSESVNAVEGRPGIDNHFMTLDTKLAGYVVSYVEFPDEITEPDAIKAILDSGREGGIASSKGELTGEKEINLKQFKGREWTIKLPKGLVAIVRAYWIRRRLYQTIFVTSPNANDSSEIMKLRQDAGTRFLDSFTLSGDNAAK